MELTQLNKINPHIISNIYINELNAIAEGKSYGQRLVDRYELEFMLWGNGYILVDDIKHKVSQGDIFFKQPGMINEGIGTYHCYYLIFDMFHNEEPYRLKEFPVVMNMRQWSRCEILFSNIYKEYILNGNTNQFILKSYLMEILRMVYEEWKAENWMMNTSQSIRNNYPRIKKIQTHILEHITQTFTLEELAQLGGLSRNFFCRIFKEISGESPINYINRNKINRAKKMLIETNMNVNEIAYNCGFENITYFYTLFKKHEETTPLEFRSRHMFHVNS